VHLRDHAHGAEIVDDGVGPESSDVDGTGLTGMRELVAFFGGEFRAGPRATGRYTVWARFPPETH
jgi:glucose-6-phosphate-specific signal transduction histidine kinase